MEILDSIGRDNKKHRCKRKQRFCYFESSSQTNQLFHRDTRGLVTIEESSIP